MISIYRSCATLHTKWTLDGDSTKASNDLQITSYKSNFTKYQMPNTSNISMNKNVKIDHDLLKNNLKW